jgi:hypothetical protein
MKEFLSKLKGATLAIAAVVALLLPTDGALAQTVVALPNNVIINSVLDMGNGPMELKVLQGNGWLFTAQGAGVGSTSGSSTTLTLTATAAADPPCVGCEISGAGITSGTTVAAFNGTTTITLSAAMTVAASTPLAWGMACPTFASLLGLPPVPNVGLPSSGGPDLPLYTQARVCLLAQNGPGLTVLPFPIGAH